MHGYPVAAGAVLGILAVSLWRYHKLPRIQAILFIASAFFLTVGITVWLDALAGLTATGTGITVLLAVLLLGSLAVWFEVVRKHKHHRIGTPVVGIVFGTAVVLGLALWHTLVHKAAKAVPRSGQALSQAIFQIRTGKAATAVPSGHRMEVLLIGAVALVILITAAIRHERGKGKGARSAPAAGRPASGSGRRPAAITSGRRR